MNATIAAPVTDAAGPTVIVRQQWNDHKLRHIFSAISQVGDRTTLVVASTPFLRDLSFTLTFDVMA